MFVHECLGCLVTQVISFFICDPTYRCETHFQCAFLGRTAQLNASVSCVLQLCRCHLETDCVLFPQAPSNMKSVLQAGWLLTVAVGNIIVLIVAGAGQFSEQVRGGERDCVCLWSS